MSIRLDLSKVRVYVKRHFRFSHVNPLHGVSKYFLNTAENMTFLHWSLLFSHYNYCGAQQTCSGQSSSFLAIHSGPLTEGEVVDHYFREFASFCPSAVKKSSFILIMYNGPLGRGCSR